MVFFMNKMLLEKGILMSELVVDLSAIKNNFAYIKRLLNNNQKLCFVAKANCYGLGAKKICKFMNQYVDMFAVSSGYEFFKIKKVTTKPILILDPIYENITKLAVCDAVFTVSNFESLNIILRSAKSDSKTKFKIHLAYNTGMNRFGFSTISEVIKVFKTCKKVQNISILGVFSHFYHVNNKIFANNQINKLLELKNILTKNRFCNGVDFHIANSGGVAIKNDFDMARVGIAMYLDATFQTISLKSKILDFQILDVGETAGYDAVFIAKRKTKIAVVGIGYADGLFRNIVNKGYVLINGNRAKIVAVCMDSLLVDVTDFSAKIYDDVVLIGKSKNEQIFICDVARWCDTIGYEIISKISSRVKRKYIG